MASQKKVVPAEVVEQLSATLSKEGTYKGSWQIGTIDDVIIGTCSVNNHAQDESGVAATGASITDHDASADFYVFGFRENKLLWVKLIKALYSCRVKNGRIELFYPFANKGESEKSSHAPTFYRDPETGNRVKEE
jgi:hypothetical protein